MNHRRFFDASLRPLRQAVARALLAAAIPLVATLQPWAGLDGDATSTGLALSATEAALPAARSAALDPALALATFDAAWQHVADSDYDFSRSGVDWSAVRDEMRPRVSDVASGEQLRQLLQEMLDRIGESHFTVIPAAAMRLHDDGKGTAGGSRTTGLTIRLIDNRAVVVAVAPDSAATRSGVRPGWVIEAVDGRPLGDALAAADALGSDAARRRALAALETQLQYLASNRSEQTPLQLTLRDGNGRARGLSIGSQPPPGQTVTVPMLPPMQLDFSHRRHSLPGGDCVGEVAFSVWVVDVNALLSDAMASLGDCRGIVLDLRGNPGGIMAVMMSVAGFFVDEPTTLGTLRTRDATLHFRAQPRRVTNEGVLVEPLDGPVAILVDSQSMSTSEMFASGMQAVGRARVFGTRTPGMALPSRTVTLPSGDVLMHAFAEYTDPNGRRIEGDGVQPDQDTPPDAASLQAGEDTSRRAAIEWIAAGGT